MTDQIISTNLAFDGPTVVEDLNRLLRLRTTPIGMKLFPSRAEMEAIPKIRRPKEIHTTDQIVGQASRNVNNATSMLQLADDATESVIDILQRMREMVLLAIDGSNSATDVALINTGFKESAAEIDRIVDSTEFNSKKLINGNAGGHNNSKVTFQVGANANQTLTIDFSDLNLVAGDDDGRPSVRSIILNDASVANYSGGIRLSKGGTTVDLSEGQIRNANTTQGLADLIDASGLYLNATHSGDKLMLANPLIGDHAGVSATEIGRELGSPFSGTKATSTLTLDNNQVSTFSGNMHLWDGVNSATLSEVQIRNANTTQGLADLIETKIINKIRGMHAKLISFQLNFKIE